MTEEVSVLDDSKDVILRCTCKTNKKDHSVSLTNAELRWHIADSKKDVQVVRIVDILSVSLKSSTKGDNDSVCVTYVKQYKKLILKSCCVLFTSADLQITSNLHQHITDLLRNVGQRPKKLLVLINPVSGRSKGRSVYAQKVAPIFQDAGIDADVIVTEKAHHTEEILSTYDIKSVNGLVVVGGDGIYHEAVNGLLRRLTTEQGLNVDDPDETLPDIDLPIGLIPCGTGNGIAHANYGNYDVVTAALSIAIGYHSPASYMTVHSGNKLIGYSVLLVGYGTWSDLIYRTENRRSQGVLRYPIAMVEQMFFKTLRRMNMTVQCQHKETPAQQDGLENKERRIDEIVNETVDGGAKGTSDNIEKSNDVSVRSATIKESVIGSITFLLTPEVAFSQTVQPDLSQSMMYLNKPSGRMKYISFLFQLMTLNFDAINARDDVATVPGKQWTVKLEEPSQPETENWQLEHAMNIDGEFFRLLEPQYKVTLQPGKLKLFSNMPYATKRVV